MRTSFFGRERPFRQPEERIHETYPLLRADASDFDHHYPRACYLAQSSLALPSDLVDEVVLQLDARSVCRLGETCRALRHCASDEIWYKLLANDYPGHELNVAIASPKRCYLELQAINEGWRRGGRLFDERFRANNQRPVYRCLRGATPACKLLLLYVVLFILIGQNFFSTLRLLLFGAAMLCLLLFTLYDRRTFNVWFAIAVPWLALEGLFFLLSTSPMIGVLALSIALLLLFARYLLLPTGHGRSRWRFALELIRRFERLQFDYYRHRR